MKKKNSFGRQLLLYVVLFGVIIVMLSSLFYNDTNGTKIESYSELSQYIRGTNDDGLVLKSVYVHNTNDITLTFEDGTQKSYKVAYVDMFYQDFQDDLLGSKDDLETEDPSNPGTEQPSRPNVTVEYQPQATMPWWVSLLPTLGIIILFVVIYFISFKKMGGGGKFNNFGKARVKTPEVDESKKVLFRDVAGADEEKEELVEIVEFLKDPTKFTKLGAKIPHGVLLQGPPGTGKTLLAKAVAGEAGVPFYSISGSDFVEMYVGVGASRVRDLFDTARKSPAAIIFIDEIDAVGRHRGAGLGGGHDEREQTLNQLLVEMDGFGSHDGIIVMAATNRPDILDPALLRPGRFDRQITVNYPDMKGREEILKVHARNKPLESGVDFHKVAQSTVGFTGADLANLLNEAALLAAKKGKSLIGMDDIEDAFMKELLGPQKKTKIRTEKENKLTAYHEAGHAVVSYYCKNTDPVKFITIIPAGRAGGVTVSVPEVDTSYNTRGEMIDRIRMGLGGRIAEELIMDDISTGASGDIQQATKIARGMVTRYGMSDRLGTVLYGSGHSEVFLGRDYGTGKEYSEQTASVIDEEIQRIINECYADAKVILSEHIDKLHFVAQYLLGHETMDGDQFKAAMQDGATVEQLEAIAAEKAEKSRRDNEERAKRQAEEEAKKAAETKTEPHDASSNDQNSEEDQSSQEEKQDEDDNNQDDNGWGNFIHRR
ncbi:MAG: ATP-dependent zinc metalloprotease FtsH [Ruminococcaceae bacterium]|nr:ATP-dependent zinc metalloprotease FtsH [Oscillospiraceae bacterium]